MERLFTGTLISDIGLARTAIGSVAFIIQVSGLVNMVGIIVDGIMVGTVAHGMVAAIITTILIHPTLIQEVVTTVVIIDNVEDSN